MDGTVSRKLLALIACAGLLLSLSIAGCAFEPRSRGPEELGGDEKSLVRHVAAYGYVNTLFTACHMGNRLYFTTKGGVAYAGPCDEVSR